MQEHQESVDSQVTEAKTEHQEPPGTAENEDPRVDRVRTAPRVDPEIRVNGDRADPVDRPERQAHQETRSGTSQ